MPRERSLANLAGENVVRERGLRLPISPFQVAKEEGIEVLAKPTTGGVSGMLLRVGDDFTIVYAHHLHNEGYERFSVAHELGHYFLPGHIDHVLGIYPILEALKGSPPEILAFGETVKILEAGDVDKICPGNLGIRPSMF